MTLTPTTRAVAGLGVTQIVGGGTTYLMPSVLRPPIQDDLGIPSELVFTGITVMFAVGALCAPRIGSIVDRIGARWLMTAGSLVYALALAGLSVSQGPIGYLAGWAVLGVASSLALSTPSSIAIVQVAGPRARRAIALLTIIGGLASSIFWPARRSTCWCCRTSRRCIRPAPTPRSPRTTWRRPSSRGRSCCCRSACRSAPSSSPAHGCT